MAIWIDWPAGVINIPRNDLTLVQSTPTEIRELDLNWFRMELKALEESDMGMAYQKTHDHNTEVNLGGITYARIIEILDPYTVTFEDGKYAVNLVGANSNVGDKVNVNQVSVRSQNSAGLISSPLIEYSSFEGGVWVHSTNGVAGTLFPTGTRLQPSNNLDDALLISQYRGFNLIYVMDKLTIDHNLDFNSYIFEGQTNINNELEILDIAQVENAVFRKLTIKGILDGGNQLINCIISDITYFYGIIKECSLTGTIKLSGNDDAAIINCVTTDPYSPPTIDMGVTGQNLSMPNYSGIINIKNMGEGSFAGIGLNGGEVILDSSTITGGTIYVSGIGFIYDENKNPISNGIWNNNVIVINDLINRNTIAESTEMTDFVYIDQVNGYTGTTHPIGTMRMPSNNIEDAVKISNTLNNKNFYFLSDFVFDSTINIENYDLYGNGIFNTTFTFNSGSTINKCQIINATVTGSINGVSTFSKCKLDDLDEFNFVDLSQPLSIHKSLLTKTISFPQNYSGSVTIIDSFTSDMLTYTVTIDGNNTNLELQIRNHSGDIKLKNIDQNNMITINMLGGHVILDSTISNCFIYVTGIGNLVDENLESILTSIWGNNVHIHNDLLSKEIITYDVWSEMLSGYTTDGSAGKTLLNASTGGVDYATLAKAVWEYLITNPPQSNEAGFILKKIGDLVDELHKLQGLDPINPMTVTTDRRTAGPNIDLKITGDGKTTTTVTRQ